MAGPPRIADFAARRLKLDTLVRLRWLAVAGQTITVLIVAYMLRFPLPIGLCFGLIALSAWLNLFLKIRYPSSLRLHGGTAILLLAYDVVQLGGLLYLTGGLQNPFAILMLVPVMVSATTLAPRLTITLGALVLALVSLLAEDIALLRSQTQRCRDILGKLTSLSEGGDQLLDRVPLSLLIEEVVAPHREVGIPIEVALSGEGGAEPVGRRNPAIHYGLGNLVENAVDFAEEKVTVEAVWSADALTLTIMDDGPGFAPEVIDHIGEPYVTTRAPSSGDAEAGGLGLGFFIAKTRLERNGGTLTLSNRTPPAHGAVVRIVWPRAAMDDAAKTGRTPAKAA